MSDTTEMVRLIRHAADRLNEEGPISLLPNTMSRVEEERCIPALQSMAAAMAYAQAILRMVAACMEPESEPIVKAMARVRALIGDGPYVRTDELLEALGEG